MSLTRSAFRHFERLRVRWAEIDAQHIVFNGHYLMYCDTAISGWWRAMALPYAATMPPLGGDFYVKKSSLEYFASARLDDLIDVGVRAARFGNSSMLLECGIFRGDALLVAGELVYVFADPATQTSKPVPQAFRDVAAAFQAGEAMTTVQVGDWATLGTEAGAIRKTVFVDEQGIPAELEWDAADANCVHAVARNRLGLALATGRLLTYEPGTAKIGRMAVLPSQRGTGVGRQVLDALMAAAKVRGERSVLLHAQASAAPFYLRAGYVAEGEPFEEAGIPHLAMRKLL
ncbi:MAG TPA: YbgC/FadM family acyl-CoA thioesterase [Aquabacterium sp.]|nr:YbgC/FadM family acyl-CoA thioesterase [Aquabacterium sp.]HQC97477.1 YbgC/FadM family acyl-CoA thioesterase [Aquabacterium sp.]